MPKISYVVPVYNAEKTLLRCVESLAYGGEPDCEILLSEDCSTDGSWELCLKLQQEFSQVRCIRNEQNSGVSRTRNHALDEADGEYILFVDSDDWVSFEYASSLLSVAQEYPDDLVMCGFRFFDQVAGYRQDYIWQANGEERYCVSKQEFFSLVDRTHIQFLWNKLFRRDVIEKAHIRFDESQSMGEDFEFVLDYMKAISCERCIVINQPLYSYIRANNTSLMSKFGIDKTYSGIARMDSLLEICGPEDAIACAGYQKSKNNLVNNYAYQIVRTKCLSKQEKVSYLTALYNSNVSIKRYMQLKWSVIKERLVANMVNVIKIKKRINNKWQRIKNKLIISHTKRLMNSSDVTLISQNCIGGVFYHDIGMEFLSPTINLFFKAADFVKFVLNLEHYLSVDLDMRWGTDYPIGMLEDIEVHFMHYDSCEQAKNAWNRRKERIQWDKIVVLATDRVGFDEVVFEQWKTVPYPKVLFTANVSFAKEPGVVYYPEYSACDFVPDLIPKREFYKDDVLVQVVNQKV